MKGCEYNPNGSLSLGQILTDPFEPSLPLLPDGPLPILQENVEFSYQGAVTDSSGSLLDTSFRVWAEVDLLPIQGDIGGHRLVGSSLSWHFDRLEGQIFVPRLPGVVEALKADTVVAQINRSRFNFRKRLYMVTGLRIARGARMVHTESHYFGAYANVGVDAATFGRAPVTSGVEGGFTNTTNNTRSFQGASDFVYAYRLCEVYYGKDVYVKPHTSGETYCVADEEEDQAMEMDGGDEDSEDVENENRILVEGISSLDYAGDGQLRQVTTSETNEEGYYIWDRAL